MEEINTFAEPVTLRCECPRQEIGFWRKNELR